MKQPPTEGKVSPICLKVISQSLCEVIIIVILKTNSRSIRRGCSHGDHAGQIVASAEQVELDSSEDGQQGQGIDECKRPSDSYDGPLDSLVPVKK